MGYDVHGAVLLCIRGLQWKNAEGARIYEANIGTEQTKYGIGYFVCCTKNIETGSHWDRTGFIKEENRNVLR